MSVELAERRAAAVERSAHTVTAIAALGVLIDALPDPAVSPRPPLLLAAILIGVGLVLGTLGERIGGRAPAGSARTVATVAALAVLFGALTDVRAGYWWQPTWPATVTAALLGLGLVASPVIRLLRTRSFQRLVQLVASVAALTAIFAAMSDGDEPQWPLWVAAALLGLGLAAGPVVERIDGRSVHGSAQTAAAVGALSGLVVSLISLPYGAPTSAEEVPIVILGIGLVVTGLLARRDGGPRERVLSARVDELSRTRRGALDVQATELRRIERDLHDGAQARLVALSMKLGRAEDRYAEQPAVSALLREAREDAAAAIRELRELARGIAPPVLTDRGLEAAVRSLAQRSGAEVTVSGELARRPRAAVETAAYFVVAESLTNAAKHAPGARVEVRIDERGGDLFVEVTDFGPGGAGPGGGGLTGLRQRVEALDGALHVTSPAGVGTQIEAVLPCGR
jgi:signal transduction histidine kinase